MPSQSRDRRIPHAQTELALLRRIRAIAAERPANGLRLGIGDDCALLRPKSGEELAVTTDLSIQGRHFRLDWHMPEAIGHRTLARGLSDLAAMGARPLAAFLSLGLPPELTRSRAGRPPWIERFYDGLLALARDTGTPLAGGDLAESPFVVADVVLVGAVPRGRALLRSGAHPGHLLYVTGALGGAAAALAQLADLATASSRHSPPRIPARLASKLAPHLNPQPRLVQGRWLVRRSRASAALDISDGLSTDLAHLCEESHVAAEIDASALPLAPGATLDHALHGGEDYELLFAAHESSPIPRSIAGIPVTRIGRVLKARAPHPHLTLITPQGPWSLEPKGWEHFS